MGLFEQISGIIFGCWLLNPPVQAMFSLSPRPRARPPPPTCSEQTEWWWAMLRACGRFLSFSSILDYYLDSKSIIQVHIGSVPPPRSIFWCVTPNFLKFGGFSIGVKNVFTRNSIWRLPAVVGLITLNPPVVFKINYHV